MQTPAPKHVIDKVSPGFLIGYLVVTGTVFVGCAVLISLNAAIGSLFITWVLGPVLLHGLIDGWHFIPAAFQRVRMHWQTVYVLLRERFHR